MKRKKHLEFYYRCMTDGRMPWHGLCNNDLDKRRLKLFKPAGMEEMDRAWSVQYWACEFEDSYDRRRSQYNFGPTRQTIVLFLAAMSGEL